MSKPAKCVVEGCPNPARAKGFCQRHYSQVWRRGTVSEPRDRLRAALEKDLEDAERLQSLERELAQARLLYECVVGFTGRIKWRRYIETVQMQIRRLTEERPQLARTAVAAAAGSALSSDAHDAHHGG